MGPVVILMLTLLLGIQPIATDLYLPALPTLAHALHASLGATQLTLSALIICFGVVQLACGPLADRFARRPLLPAGIATLVRRHGEVKPSPATQVA
jgi:MFS transporter, DHA1 family, multidrug resistance protein